jgi:hypothetical protein
LKRRNSAQGTRLYNKYKKKRKDDKDVGNYKMNKEEIFLETSNMGANFLQMMKRSYMKSTRNIRPSSLEIITHWEE